MKDLSRERWHQIDALFLAVMEQPPDKQLTFLSEACGGDAALFAEVEALLAASGEAEAVLGESVSQFLGPEGRELDRRLVGGLSDGTRVGPYRVVEEVGRGGMATVYLVERADDQYRQRLALKVLRRGIDSEDALRRFRYERQILARLDHPNIARLYDGGVTPDGRPYLVMEYVNGQPIDAYCDAHRLTVDERLRLFTRVCAAVSYAHQNLIVHRDLKPSNVLVSEAGEVKLLDFGIARLMDDEAADVSVPVTRTGMRVMTPEYAAPEQIRGGAITTATDVYALGIVLYQLLTGRRPYYLTYRSPSDIERTVFETEPDRPSTAVTRVKAQPSGDANTPLPEQVSADRRTTTDRLQRRLRGDLDTIVLMALRKEPERRYRSAEQLVDDLQRHLDGLPVAARQDTLRYRTHKFVRRHRLAVGATVLVLLLAVASVAVLLVQRAEILRERDRAALERDKAEQVVALFTGLFEEADPLTAQGDTLNVYELLDLATRRVQGDTAAVPDAQANVLHVLGTIYTNMAAYDRARPLLEDALRIRTNLYGEQHEDVASTLDALGVLVREMGEYEEAARLHRQVLAIERRLPAVDTSHVAHALTQLSVSLQRGGAYEEAQAVLTEAIDLYETWGHQDDPRLPEALNNLGILRYEAGDFAGAEVAFRDALARMRRHRGDGHPYVAQVLNSLGSALQYSGKLEEAEPAYQEALRIQRAAYGEAHPEVSLTYNNLATIYDELGRHDLADSLYRKVIRLDSELLGPDHPQVAITMHNLGLMLLETDRVAEAEEWVRRARVNLVEALGPDHLHTLIISGSMGLVLSDAGKLGEAEQLLRSTLAALSQQIPATHWRIAVLERNLGACLTAQGRYAEAESLLLKSVATLRKEPGEEAEATQEAVRRLVLLYHASGREDLAAQYQRSSGVRE